MILIDVIESALLAALLIILLKDVWLYALKNPRISVTNKNVCRRALTTHTQTTQPVYAFHLQTVQTAQRQPMVTQHPNDAYSNALTTTTQMCVMTLCYVYRYALRVGTQMMKVNIV